MSNRQGAFHHSWIPLLLLLLAYAFNLASPQSGTGGSIAGQVADSGGRLFPALVTLRNTATGSASQMRCDHNGNFRFAELAPGSYSIRVSAPGLAPWKMERVVVEVGRVTLLAPKLTLAYDEHAAATKDHPSQADFSPAVASNVDLQALENLPSSNGQWSGLAGLSAGTAPGSGTSPDGNNALSFRGLSPLLNSITIESFAHQLDAVAFAERRGHAGVGYLRHR